MFWPTRVLCQSSLACTVWWFLLCLVCPYPGCELMYSGISGSLELWMFLLGGIQWHPLIPNSGRGIKGALDTGRDALRMRTRTVTYVTYRVIGSPPRKSIYPRMPRSGIAENYPTRTYYRLRHYGKLSTSASAL